MATDIENPNPERLIYQLNTTVQTTANDFISDKFELIHKDSTNFHWGSVELVTKAKLDAKESPYLLSVTAYDGPPNLGTTLSSKKTIKVNVLNKGSMSVWVDKNTGESVDYYSVSVLEEQEPNTLVLSVQAVLFSLDSNEPDNTSLIYEIESNLKSEDKDDLVSDSNPYFRMEPATGKIFTTETRLDYEETSTFKKQQMRDIKIKAASLDGFHRYTTHVSIEILDRNDNVPKFDFYIESKSNSSLFCIVENSTHSSVS